MLEIFEEMGAFLEEHKNKFNNEDWDETKSILIEYKTSVSSKLSEDFFKENNELLHETLIKNIEMCDRIFSKIIILDKEYNFSTTSFTKSSQV